jgi:hypothetical protein
MVLLSAGSSALFLGITGAWRQKVENQFFIDSHLVSGKIGADGELRRTTVGTNGEETR